VPSFFYALDTDLLPFSGPQVTWAGEFLWRFENQPPDTKYFGFGTENGAIYIYDTLGKRIAADRAPQGLESINGIAFIPGAMAVSTPGEILISMAATKARETPSLHLGQGAYGIVSTRKEDGFIATLGPGGLLHMRRISDDAFLTNHFHSANTDVFFYKIASVGITEANAEVFVCAARRSGLATVVINAHGHAETIWLSNGRKRDLDIVDVCPIPSEKYPYAVVCLGRDATLHFAFDISEESPPVSLKLRDLRGTPFSVLSAQGHVFILTSEEFCIFPGMTTRFHSNEAFKQKSRVFRSPVQAIDCSIAYNEYILTVVENGVYVYNIAKLMSFLAQDPPEADAESHPAEADFIEPIEEDFGWETQKMSDLQTVLVPA
jgi:hypothetical protein